MICQYLIEINLKFVRKTRDKIKGKQEIKLVIERKIVENEIDINWYGKAY